MAKEFPHAVLPGLELEDMRSTMPVTTRRLLDLAEEIYGEDTAGNIAFLHATLALCGMPYSRPAEGVTTYERRNGRASLLIKAGSAVDPQTGQWVAQTLPYGPTARVIMVYICSEAVRKRSKVIDMSETMCGFMQTLGIQPTGGRNGSIPRFKKQLQAVIAAHMQIAWIDDDSAYSIDARPVKGSKIWLPEKGGPSTWESVIRLHDDFFDSLCQYAVPLDARALAALTHNALAMDIYFWLTHRLHRVRRPEGEFVGWEALYEQFGRPYAQIRDFRLKFRQRLRQALAVYPGAKLEQLGNKGLRLFHSPPPVAARPKLISSA